MNKLLLFFLLFSLSATSQTKDTVFLDHYEILEPNLYQYIKENVIEKLSDQDKCTITSGESKKELGFVLLLMNKEDRAMKEYQKDIF